MEHVERHFHRVAKYAESPALVRLLECVEQLRAEAGERQVDEAYVAIAQSARSAPSTSAAVVVLANDEGAGG